VEPLIVQPGDGERVSRKVSVLAETDRIVVTEMLYVPGDTGPDPHIHREHSDCFWVVGGRVVFEVGREAMRLEMPAGSFVGVPREVVHTFRNEGPEDARILNLHVPGCDFARYLRELYAGDDTSWFDAYDPPPDGGPPASVAVVVPPGEGEREGGESDAAIVWKSRMVDLTLSERGLPAGASAAADEVVYVLEGRASIADVEIGPGTFAYGADTLSNPGPGPATVLFARA
jgi:mannose-6-phosphate isomerase-like protein (cupin superfamily)